MSTFGTCKFCGQTMMVEGIETQLSRDDYASKNCKCKEGMRYRNIEDVKEAAKANAEALFVLDPHASAEQIKKHKDLLNLLNCIIENVAEGIIEKSSVKIGERTSVSIFITSLDGIRIKKSYKEDYVLEANRH